MLGEFDKLVEGTGKALETVPDLYDDAIKPSAQEFGKTAALIPRTINAALVPLRQWIAQREYNLSETEKLIAEKLANVSAEKIVTPEPYVVVPAFQAISYSMNSEELRNLYANLLSRAMNIDTKDSVHPAFVEIIKQLSPIDASIFNIIHNSKTTPLIDLKLQDTINGLGGYVDVFKNISWITTYTHNQTNVSFDNLSRLKLINISDTYYTHEKHYDLVKNTTVYKVYYETFVKSLKDNQKIIENKKIIKVTDIGKLFYNICVL